MATCRRCGVEVGCGCNLNNGLCANCFAAVAAGASEVIQRFKNAYLSVKRGLCWLF